MFQFIKNKLTSIYNRFTSKIGALFSRDTIDEQTIKELEEVLITSDVGVHTTKMIIEKLKNELSTTHINGSQAREKLAKILQTILMQPTKVTILNESIFLLVGINGSGKTTFAGKLAHFLKQSGKKVLFVAADTFRAAAATQLKEWSKKVEIDCIEGELNADPASVIFKGCQAFLSGNYDCIVIDTAGRLQTKSNLMKELEKLCRVIKKQLSDRAICTLLTIDALIGQNSLEQARIFQECTAVNGIVLTKMDSSSKGGIVFAIADTLSIPVVFISYGEKITDLMVFNPITYTKELLGDES